MIDFHTHTLPGIDDGAKDSRTSIQMLQKEIEQGVKTLVFTPHYYGRKRSPEQFLQRRNAAFEKIKDGIPAQLDVRLGSEVFFTGVNMASNEELCSLAIEGTKYVLFEFPMIGKWQNSVWESLSEFIHETDYTPIVAHVERYAETQKNPASVHRLIELGCLLQVNTTAFLDKCSQSFAFALLKHGLVHCLGSDSHDLQLRVCDYEQAKSVICGKGYAKEFDEMQNNMRQILDGEYLTPQACTRLKKFLGRYY